MKKLKQRFEDDPAFAITTIIIGASVGAMVLKGVAGLVTASAYAYRASKMN